jgi:hypothetical protein
MHIVAMQKYPAPQKPSSGLSPKQHGSPAPPHSPQIGVEPSHVAYGAVHPSGPCEQHASPTAPQLPHRPAAHAPPLTQ